MWSNSINAAKKKKKKKKNLPKHLTRTHAQLKSGKDILNTRIVLNDFKPTGVKIYCNERLTKGQTISLTLDHPKRFFSKGVILWCEELQLSSRVITENPFNYRIGIQFTFDSEEEQKTVHDYAIEILQSCTGIKAAPQPTVTQYAKSAKDPAEVKESTSESPEAIKPEATTAQESAPQEEKKAA